MAWYAVNAGSLTGGKMLGVTGSGMVCLVLLKPNLFA